MAKPFFYGWILLGVLWLVFAFNLGFPAYGGPVINNAMADAVGFSRGPLGLITDGTHTVQRKKVVALALEPRFHEIVYTDALGDDRAYFKPHPMAFERVAAAIGVPGDRFVYVGDNPVKDFVAPNAMGWITVQIVRDGGIHDATKVIDGGAPQHKITSLAELPDILGI